MTVDLRKSQMLTTSLVMTICGNSMITVDHLQDKIHRDLNNKDKVSPIVRIMVTSLVLITSTNSSKVNMPTKGISKINNRVIHSTLDITKFHSAGMTELYTHTEVQGHRPMNNSTRRL